MAITNRPPEYNEIRRLPDEILYFLQDEIITCGGDETAFSEVLPKSGKICYNQ